jgi:hypothetical protein
VEDGRCSTSFLESTIGGQSAAALSTRSGYIRAKTIFVYRIMVIGPRVDAAINVKLRHDIVAYIPILGLYCRRISGYQSEATKTNEPGNWPAKRHTRALAEEVDGLRLGSRARFRRRQRSGSRIVG